ncbi:MAG: hypothetical protein ACRCTJ_05670, partial [Brevinema sp.]
ELDIEGLTLKNSPFVKDVGYVLKIYVNNTSTRESVLSLKIDLLVLSSGKVSSREFGVPRSNIKMITKEMDLLLQKVIPQKDNNPVTVLSNSGDIFYFTNNARGLRRGDEIRIQYQNPRKKSTESPAVVMHISSNLIKAKDLHGFVEPKDKVLPVSPKRNRFSFNIHATIPTFGNRIVEGSLNNHIFKSSPRWPAGFTIEGEYERFIPYQLVSTTVFGVSVDSVLGTHLMTGIGYRGLVGHWEFTPYIRLGFLYNPLAFKSDTSADLLQGLTLRIGVNLGLSIMRRITDDIFIGLDFGLRWYFYDFVNLSLGDQNVKPSWKGGTFALSELYPYIGLKIGWIF